MGFLDDLLGPLLGGGSGQFEPPTQLEDFPENQAIREMLGGFFEQQGPGASPAFGGQLTADTNQLFQQLAQQLTGPGGGAPADPFAGILSGLVNRFSGAGGPGGAVGWSPGTGVWDQGATQQGPVPQAGGGAPVGPSPFFGWQNPSVPPPGLGGLPPGGASPPGAQPPTGDPITGGAGPGTGGGVDFGGGRNEPINPKISHHGLTIGDNPGLLEALGLTPVDPANPIPLEELLRRMDLQLPGQPLQPPRPQPVQQPGQIGQLGGQPDQTIPLLERLLGLGG